MNNDDKNRAGDESLGLIGSGTAFGNVPTTSFGNPPTTSFGNSTPSFGNGPATSFGNAPTPSLTCSVPFLRKPNFGNAPTTSFGIGMNHAPGPIFGNAPTTAFGNSTPSFGNGSAFGTSSNSLSFGMASTNNNDDDDSFELARQGNLDGLKSALDKNPSDISRRGGIGSKTLLHQASMGGSLNCVEHLVEKGSDLDAKDQVIDVYCY